MKIVLESSGGIGNIRIKGELEIDSLAPELREKLNSLLDRLGTEQLTEQENSRMADATGYELTVIPEDDVEGVRRVLLDEARHDREALSVGKELLREIVKRKRNQSK
ncbi:MAG: hypothetical protein OER96_07885 [Gammaproteobacteria bacterium]|nr:hypothetical protein [Gammaproteobacteria bacterium]